MYQRSKVLIFSFNLRFMSAFIPRLTELLTSELRFETVVNE